MRNGTDYMHGQPVTPLRNAIAVNKLLVNSSRLLIHDGSGVSAKIHFRPYNFDNTSTHMRAVCS